MASALHIRLTNSDTRVHYDHGIDVIKNHKLNFYGSFGFQRDWSKYNFKLGFQLIEKDATVDNRIRITHNHVHLSLFRMLLGSTEQLQTLMTLDLELLELSILLINNLSKKLKFQD